MKSNILKMGIKNIIYTFSSQLVAMMLSFVTSFILPMLLGIEEFGYWQVYVFYFSYIPIFFIGFNDGIYLRYGGYDYENLPFKKIRGAVSIFFIMQIIISSVLIILCLIIENDPNKSYALIMDIILIPVSALNAVSVSIMLLSNRIKQYTFITILGKLMLLIILVFLFIIDIYNYRIIIISDQIVKFIIAAISIIFCKDIFFGEKSSFKIGVSELIADIICGISLMLAMLIGTFITGIGRVLVERFMSVKEYGIYSFAFSAINLVLVLVTSVGVVVYPILKKINEENLKIYFNKLNTILCCITFIALLTYFPIHYLINKYIIKYKDVLKFLFILFPIIIYQSKIQIIINSYYKTLRKEKIMLKFNVISILIYIVITVPLFFIIKSITLIAITTLLITIFLCYKSEVYIKKELNIDLRTNILLELMLVCGFILIGGYINSLIIGVCLYTFLLSIYFILNKNEICNIIYMISSKLELKKNI